MGWLEQLFPARRRTWDAMSLESIFNDAAKGRTIEELFHEGARGEVPGPIRALRNEVAHAITTGGIPRLSADEAFYLHRVNEWLPITKCLGRLLLLHEFPGQLWGKLGPRGRSTPPRENEIDALADSPGRADRKCDLEQT